MVKRGFVLSPFAGFGVGIGSVSCVAKRKEKKRLEEGRRDSFASSSSSLSLSPFHLLLLLQHLPELLLLLPGSPSDDTRRPPLRPAEHRSGAPSRRQQTAAGRLGPGGGTANWIIPDPAGSSQFRPVRQAFHFPSLWPFASLLGVLVTLQGVPVTLQGGRTVRV